jgi:hypothetical protein
VSSLSSIGNARRLDRVLPWIGAVVLAAGVATFLVVYFGRSDSSPKTASNEQVVRKTPPTVRVPAPARQVAIAFLTTAVTRKHLASSYGLATPTLRQGLSEKQWLTGNIPVPYYPANSKSVKAAKYTTDYSHPRDIQLEIAVGPPNGIKEQPADFLVGLVKRHGQWRVDYWGTQTHVPVPAAGVS